MKQIWIAGIIIVIGLSSILNGADGLLTGRVRDTNTHQPLIGVNIIISGTDLGSATDSLGNFMIKNIPVGSYDVNASMIGYKPITRPNVHIVPKRASVANFDLHLTVLEGEDIVVTGNYFEKTKDAVTSNRTIDIEEIRSDPVGVYDIMAMMQALPSVISGNDQSNEVIVRGGMHNENLFVMDYLEIPFPNHFPQQGKGGGPVTMVETDFIERIDFYAGAFPARYGEKLSSVMDVKLRDGNRERHLGQLSMNMAGFGGNIEGPLMKDGSYLLSLQRSFLDFVMRGTGLQAIPEYWTSQGKLTFNISPTKKLMYNYLGGIDAVKLENENDPSMRGAENVDYSSKQITSGITYKDLFSKKGFGIVSISSSALILDLNVYELELNDNDNSYKNDYARNNDIEIENTLRGEINYSLSKRFNLNTGFSTKLLRLDYDRWFKIRPNYIYGYSFSGDIPSIISRAEFDNIYFNNKNTIATPLDTIGIPDTNITNHLLELWKTGGFIHLTYQPTKKLDVLVGGRYDHLSYTNKASFSPRLGLSYHVNQILTLNFSGGRYFQFPNNRDLNSNKLGQSSLTSYYADQSAIGIEYFSARDKRITLEIYTKTMGDIVINEILEDSDGRDSINYKKIINAGKGRSKGLELFIQKKYFNNWYGSLAWSHSISEMWDDRDEGKYYNWDYDYGDVINVIGGYKIEYKKYDWYQKYKKTYWSYLFNLLPFSPSDEYEISFKLRYLGGRPYTPKTYDHNIREWYTSSEGDWNTKRYGSYLRFDLMLQQRYYFDQINMVIFYDFLNLFNKDNEWENIYLDDGTIKIAYQYKTIPTAGVIIEF